ncbi:uncharacterized protein MONBRDRAFT_34748 [Monosiga brevicollis MX1]|uniref:Protein kinase domain-containing protein n=1 Tax=Monosiga brevicollis TaxID=81824 RepID=A9VDS3_MONBE|nr:uncharacterized protein MONBRDRAFT_34748 [Monosiga brevicollis MX1]EDQ84310.1 predicted protein [Monosiga brevicollis MX1]|eukprot:XP_001750880.1 hypothetical protein [Monosiga brevicollis MX1]
MTAASHVLMDQITCHRMEQPNHVYVDAYFCIFVQEEAVNTTLRESVLFGLSTVLLIQGTDTLLENLNINWALNSDGLPFALGFNTCNIMPGPSTNNTMMRNVKSLAQLGGYGLNISGTDTLAEDSVFGHFSDNVGLNMALAVYIHHISRNTLLQGSDRFALRLQATVGLETFGQNVTVRNATFNNNMYESTTMIRVRGGSCWFLEWPDDGRPYRGWPFTKEDPDPLHPEFEYLHDVYNLAQPGYPYKKLSVPVLFDKKTQTIVNNESSEIIRMFNSQFNDLAKRPELDLEPADLESAMTEIDELVYPNINDRSIDEAPPEFPAMDWPAFRATTTQALGALDQALAAPEALNNRLKQLDPNTDNLESVLQELHGVTAGFELHPVLLELQTVLAACPAPPTALTMAPETLPANLGAALDKVAMLHDVGAKRQELLTSANSNLQQLAKALITALRAVARVGITDTDHRMNTLEQCVEGLDVSAPPPAEALPEAWEELCQAHEKLSLPEQNGLEQLITWRVEHDYEHQDWYLAFALHESQALMQQLQDMIDWQATTLSVLTSCEEYASGITQSSADQVVSIHEEVAELQKNIQTTTAFLPLASDEMQAELEARLQTMKERLVTLQQQLSDQTQVDQVAALAELLHQHFPALLIFLHPEQSALGARLRTVLGPDLPASLILEAMTEVDRTLSLSSLGQLELHYNQNHKVYKARAALPNLPEQDLAVKEYAFARQHKQDQCRTFLRELRAMRQLEHPHIIPVLGALVDVHSGHPSAYLVQPWCTQGDLQQWLGKARHLATSTVIAGLMTQLRSALAFMHSKGLVHRDVKLSNIMLDGAEDQPVVRLGDFDIAKAAAEATMLPCTATASSGTAGYVAPEVLFGMGRVGARPAQDAFSFGCVVYNTYMYPQTVPPARLPTDQLVDKCTWDAGAGNANFGFPHLAAEMCDSSSDLYKKTRALLAADPKQRPSLFSAGQIAERPVTTQVVGPAIDVLRDAPELISEVGELLQQLNTDGRGPANITVQRVERVHNPVLWERYSAKRREMLHRIKSQVHYDQLQTATLDAPSGSPALLRDASCQERLLLHGIAPDTMLRDKIVRLGLDYRFAGNNVGHRFGLGVYLADHPGKSHRYTNTGPNGERMLVITRALLGHAFVHPSPPSGALAPPLLPAAPNNERYDSVVATPSGEFHEVVVFKNAQIWLSLNERHTFPYMDREISMLIFMFLLLGKPLEHRLSSWLEKRGRLATSDDYAAFRRKTTTYLYRPTLGMCDATSGLYKETWACLQQISSSAQLSSAPGRVCNAHVVGPAIDVLCDTPELVSEVAELLQQLIADGLGPGNAAGQRVARVQNPVRWERHNTKRREILHRLTIQLCFVIHPVKSAGCFTPEQSLRDKIVAIYDHSHIYSELVVSYTRSNDAKLEAV